MLIRAYSTNPDGWGIQVVASNSAPVAKLRSAKSQHCWQQTDALGNVTTFHWSICEYVLR